MARLESTVKQLRRALRGGTVRLTLSDGTRRHIDPDEAFLEIFGHGFEAMRSEYFGEPYPKPPAVLTDIGRVRSPKERSRALGGILRGSSPLCAYDLDRLVGEGELVSRTFRSSEEGQGEDDG